MKTWDETRAEILKKIEGRLSQSMPPEDCDSMMRTLRGGGPNATALIDAFVGVYREMEVLYQYAKQDADQASALDRMAYESGIQREVAMDPGIEFTREWIPLEEPTSPPNHNCECGAYSLGFKERGVGHSSWCPMSNT